MRSLEQQNQKFIEALETLNPAQRKAVETIEGPVLVIAGPGTGKTQILAARIGKILSETDVNGQNILCLTYTDAGTIAMRKRLFDFIGPEAYKVNIFTFHSFCNEIIQNDPEKFGWYQLNSITDLESIELFQELIDSIPTNSKLKRNTGEVYHDINNLKSLFSFMKKENFDAERLKEKADKYLLDIEESEEGSEYYEKFKYKRKYKEKNVGDLKPAFDEEKGKIEKLKLASDLFPKFNEMMARKGLYDFDDMILWVLKAFKSDAHFLQLYQEKYQYILVDEYQDTSQTQNELIELLSNYWDIPNVFVVGDDDQSIYSFQGAQNENIIKFKNAHEQHLETIILTENYRSTQNILNASNHLIENNKDRLIYEMEGLNKILVSKTRQSDIKPEIRGFSSTHQEFAFVANEVDALLEKEFNPAEIAIIYKEHKIGNELANYFLQKKIPIQAKKKINILELALVKKIVKILNYLQAEKKKSGSGDPLLFEILHYHNFNIKAHAIATIAWKVREDYKSKDANNYYGIRDYIVKEVKEENSPEKKAMDVLEYLIQESTQITVQDLLEQTIKKTGILKEVLTGADKNFQLEVLTSFFNFLKEECQVNSDLDLEGFLEKIELMEKNNLSIDINQNIFNANGVQFLTCHGSKGLEFEYVFFIGANAEYWEKKRGGNRGFKIPPNAIKDNNTVEDSLEELRRLFYVVMTRSKKHLYISYSEQNKEGKLLERSNFLGELIAKAEIGNAFKVLEENILEDYLSLQFSEEEEKPKIELIDKNYIDKFLEDYSLSVTHLNNYLKCPLNFYFQNLLSVPSAKNSSLVFGSAVHYAMQKLFMRMKDNENQEFPEAQIFLEDFEWYMKKHKEGFTKTEYERRLNYAKEFLPKYLSTHKENWEKKVEVEKKIRNVHIDGVPVNGILDKVEFGKDFVNIVDYKTGKFDNAKPKLMRPNDKNILGGDYWRQAVFYKLMIDNDNMNHWKINQVVFDFVEPDSKSGEYITEKVIITAEDEEIVKIQIKDVFDKIKNYEFKEGCGEKDCDWCNFVSELMVH